MEDDLQERQPQRKITFDNWKSAKQTLCHLLHQSSRTQTDFQNYEKLKNNLN